MVKTASYSAIRNFRIDDNIAGYTVPGYSFRKDYRRAVRSTRRAINADTRRIAKEVA